MTRPSYSHSHAEPRPVSMRFLHFSTTDGPGGAGRAAYRLHTALRGAGHASQMLVRHRGSGNGLGFTDYCNVQAVPTSKLVAQLRRLQKHLPWIHPPRARFTFNNDLETGVRWRGAVDAVEQPVDAVCLHWVADFLTSRSIRAIYHRFDVPLLWTAMDQEPVTGGCHYAFGCEGYEHECGNCPLLERPSAVDRSRQVFLRKQRYLGDLPITFIAPTSWVEERIRQSALFGRHRVERIPLAIDTSVFRVDDRAVARRALGIPLKKQVIFFGSSYLHEPRKGGDHLIEAIRRFQMDLSRAQQGQTIAADDVLLLMAGRNGEELKRRLPFAVCDLGYLNDEGKLAKAYQAADVFICPSIEDAGPMMIPESMLCGTPVVAFHAGGAPDLVVSGLTGYLARVNDAADLAQGIVQVLASPQRVGLGEAAAQAARQLHEPHDVAQRYAALVEELARGHHLAGDERRPAAA
ncbi:MAG: glycosyltransferase [Pirellulales bacterium]